MKPRATPQPAYERETVERLLDTAERLFGEQGYDGVGMRELAAEARVNLGAATYHFGSKRALYLETFLRRFRPINADRLRLLKAAQGACRPLTTEKIVECLVRPAYMGGLAQPGFHALVARSLFMPPPFLHAALHREFEPNLEVFIAALRGTLAGVPEDLIRLRTMFSLGSLLIFSVQRDKFWRRRNPKFEERLLQELVRFISAGFQSKPASSASRRAPHIRFPKPRRR